MGKMTRIGFDPDVVGNVLIRITDIFGSAILLSVNRVADEASRVATEL